MDQEEWESAIKKKFSDLGNWKLDRDDEEYLGFSCIDGKHHWIRDYNKKKRNFVQYDGNQKVSIIIKQ